MCKSNQATISKQITMHLDGNTPADFQRALDTALDELKNGTRGGAGGTNSFTYEIETRDVTLMPVSAREAAQKELEQLRANAVLWEHYRLEIQNLEKHMAKLAGSYLELGAYADVATCATRAEGARFVLGRMPPPNPGLKVS
jgi:hypothetical protein